MKCSNCGGTEFTQLYNTANDLTCVNCYVVADENPIVLEVTFGELVLGAAVVQGSFVGADQAHAAVGLRGLLLELREQTIANGKRRIRNVAAALKIPEYILEAAIQWFQLALNYNFVQGRRLQNVVAACLYVACRKEKTHHMLIDFLLRLQILVFSVGATFLKMVKALHITLLPLADPLLFIQHFAEKLEFGKLKIKVVRDAMKLAQRMAHDWIHEGRRPAGVAGACVLLASRIHGFRRTHAEIVAVAHVGEETLQRRLNEFKKTNSGRLLIKEFREGAEVRAVNPPSFTRNRMADQELAMLETLNKGQDPEASATKDPVWRTLLNDCDLTELEIQEQLKRVTRRMKARQLSAASDADGLLPVVDVETAPPAKDMDHPRGLVRYLPSTGEVLAKVLLDPEEFDDIDDDELDLLLLTPEELKMKERVWIGLNQDYLLDQEVKRLKAVLDELNGTPQRKRRRRDQKLDAAGAAEAAAINGVLRGEALVPEEPVKRLSKKINYSAIGNLTSDYY